MPRTNESDNDEDGWELTYETIDFAPIWSRSDFERYALSQGWRPPVKDEAGKTIYA